MNVHRVLLYILLASPMLAGCSGDNTVSVSQQDKSATHKVIQNRKAVAANYQGEVEALYVAYFGRPADPTGLANFEAALLAANAPTDLASLSAAYSTNPVIQALINSFGNSQESVALYGNSNPTAFVNAVFQNVLNRGPQSSGLTYWVDAISNGTLSQGNAALSIMLGALANTSAQGQIDAALVDNRLAAATNFSLSINTPATLSAYSGSAAALSARTLLASVTNTTDLSDFQNNIYSTLAALVAANTTTFPVDAAVTAFYQTAQSINTTYTNAQGNQFDLAYVSNPGSNSTFAGQTVQTSNVTITLTENGNVISTEQAIIYFQTGPFKLIGELINGVEYEVASNQVPLPAFAEIGATGDFATGTLYSNSSMSSVVANIVQTWDIQASPTTGTAYICTNPTETTTAGVASTSSACYQTNTNGEISGFKLSITENGETIVFNSSAATVPPVSVPTPATLGCGAAGGAGYNGLSFISPIGTNGYFVDSNSYANQSSIDGLVYGISFDNPNYSLSSYSGSLRIQLWAFPTSYTGSSLDGFLMSTLSPDFTGVGAYSSNQIYNSFYTSLIASSGSGLNPPAGTYCVSAILQEDIGTCGSSDGYCTIDWRNVINPQTYY